MPYGTLNTGAITPGSGNTLTVSETVSLPTTTLAAGKDLETSTTGKIKQKGAFMQSSFHQSLTLGY